MSIARNATGRVDMAIPKITEFHSFSCIEEKEVFEASVAHIMTVISATEIEIRAERLSLPKSAMP